MEEDGEKYKFTGIINIYNEENNTSLNYTGIFNGNNTRTGEKEIDIVFELKDANKSVGDAVVTYYTHPAFTFGNKELSGIWVGKFETTGDATTPTILPNITSLRNENVSSQFAISLKFAGGIQSGSNVTFSGNNTYGLVSTTNSHMIKNSEWGAVAYLSHSQYGINSEIRINNNSNYITGCGASVIDGESSTVCQIEYGKAISYPQSTTGNITGIFDMSGGAFEYVMGNYGNVISSSGFTTFPDNKYNDLYTNSCNLGICGGHALNETAGWYDDLYTFVNSDVPWYGRGGGVRTSDTTGTGSQAGIFSYGRFYGGRGTYIGSRLVVVVN